MKVRYLSSEIDVITLPPMHSPRSGTKTAFHFASGLALSLSWLAIEFWFANPDRHFLIVLPLLASLQVTASLHNFFGVRIGIGPEGIYYRFRTKITLYPPEDVVSVTEVDLHIHKDQVCSTLTIELSDGEMLYLQPSSAASIYRESIISRWQSVYTGLTREEILSAPFLEDAFRRHFRFFWEWLDLFMGRDRKPIFLDQSEIRTLK